MIWVGGRIVGVDELTVGVRDRTFEHGLGLFETFRTWSGRPTLLARHLARLAASARLLDLPLDPAALPDAGAVAALLAANRAEGDARLRITLTGGTSSDSGAVVWMRAGPLPPPIRAEGASVALGTWEVSWNDPLARHKSLNYWARRIAFDDAHAAGVDEAIGRTPDGRYWEGTRTNYFVVVGETLATPTVDGPIVPGVMRALVIEQAQALGMEVIQEDHPSSSLFRSASEMFLCNSVRGIVPVARAGGYTFKVPGARTWQLAGAVSDWLERGEVAS